MMEVKCNDKGVNATGNQAVSGSPLPRPYAKPVLVELGDVRDLTLGASQGVPESGGAPGSLLP